MDISTISDIVSEAGIIATLIYHPDYSLFSEQLKSKHFVQKDNAVIYQAICKLYKNSVTKIDIYNLYQIIDNDITLKDQFNTTIENLQTIINLAENIARHSVSEYNLLVKTVIEFASRRAYFIALDRGKAYCGINNANSFLDIKRAIYDELTKVENEFSSEEEISLLGDIVDELWVQTLVRQAKNGYIGISSKFPAVSEYFTYDPGEVVLFCGKTGTGKSMMCMNEVVHKLTLPKNNNDEEMSVLYIDTEMSDQEFFNRMLASITGIETNTIKSGYYSEADAKKIDEAIAWIKTKKIVHLYLPESNEQIIWEKCKQAQLQYGMNFLVYDYVKSGDEVEANKVYNSMGKTLNFIKNAIAGKMKIPCICAAQLGRNGTIADSWKLIMYSSVVVFLLKKDEKEIIKDGVDCGNYKLLVTKNRHGKVMADETTDYIDLSFQGGRATFTQSAKQHKNIIQKTPFDN